MTKKEEKLKLNLYQKLLKIQTEITALKADTQSSGYKYLNMEKILLYVKPRMNELGLLLKQEVLDFDNERIDYRVSIKEVYEGGKPTGKYVGKPKSEILTKVKMKMTWIDVESGETDVSLWGANGQNDWEKGFGSALTYGERYFIMKYFHLSTDKDDVDNPNRKIEPIIGKLEKGLNPTPKDTAKKGNTITPPTPVKAKTEETVKPSEVLEPITDKQKARIHILFKDSIANKENLYDFYRIKSCSELNTDDAGMLIDTLAQIKNDSKGNITQIQIGQLSILLKQKGYSRKGLLEKHGLKKLDDMTCLKANEIMIGLRKLVNKN